MTLPELGHLVSTRGVHEVMKESLDFTDFIAVCMGRYLDNDWGDLCAEDAALNDDAVKEGDRILASYKFPEGHKWDAGRDSAIWIITESDRSATTVLFPSEY